MKPQWSERSTVWTLKRELIFTSKPTMQKWLSSCSSVIRLYETFNISTVTHKTYTFTNAKSWVSCFGFTYQSQQRDNKVLTEYILCRKWNTDHNVCGYLTSIFIFIFFMRNAEKFTIKNISFISRGAISKYSIWKET